MQGYYPRVHVPYVSLVDELGNMWNLDYDELEQAHLQKLDIFRARALQRDWKDVWRLLGVNFR